MQFLFGEIIGQHINLYLSSENVIAEKNANFLYKLNFKLRKIHFLMGRDILGRLERYILPEIICKKVSVI